MPRNETAEDAARDSKNRSLSDGGNPTDPRPPFPPGESGATLNETTRRLAGEGPDTPDNE